MKVRKTVNIEFNDTETKLIESMIEGITREINKQNRMIVQYITHPNKKGNFDLDNELPTVLHAWKLFLNGQDVPIKVIERLLKNISENKYHYTNIDEYRQILTMVQSYF